MIEMPAGSRRHQSPLIDLGTRRSFLAPSDTADFNSVRSASESISNFGTFLAPWALKSHYFYFHKLMGYVRASFLIAGLSGLTK
jgi:hypothetical protein